MSSEQPKTFAESTAEIRHVMAGGRGRVTRVSKLTRSRVNGNLDRTPPRNNDESAQEIRDAMDEPVSGEDKNTPASFHY